MDRFLIAMLAITVVGYSVTLWIQPSLAVSSLKASYSMLLQSIIWILVSIFLAGLIEQWVQKKVVYLQVGKPNFWSEIGMGTLLGIFGTGSRWAAYPFAVTLLKTGLSPAGIIAFLTSWFLISLPRLGAEIPFLGFKFVLFRLFLSIGVSVLAGALTKLFWR